MRRTVSQVGRSVCTQQYLEELLTATPGGCKRYFRSTPLDTSPMTVAAHAAARA